MRNTNRLGCLTGTGIITAAVTALMIAGYAYAKGGLLYNPGLLNAQSGKLLGGVASHAEIGGDCKACHTAPWEAATITDRCAVCHTDIATQMRSVATMHGTVMHDNPPALAVTIAIPNIAAQTPNLRSCRTRRSRTRRWDTR